VFGSATEDVGAPAIELSAYSIVHIIVRCTDLRKASLRSSIAHVFRFPPSIPNHHQLLLVYSFARFDSVTLLALPLLLVACGEGQNRSDVGHLRRRLPCGEGEVDKVGLRAVLKSEVGNSEGAPKQGTESTIDVASVKCRMSFV
jgi:hypothetical protein